MGRTLLQVARRGTTRHVSVIQSDHYDPDEHNRLVDDGFQVRYLDLEEAFERGGTVPPPKRRTSFDRVDADLRLRRGHHDKPQQPLDRKALDDIYFVLITLSCATHHAQDSDLNDAISRAISVVYQLKNGRSIDMSWWDKGTAQDGGKL